MSLHKIHTRMVIGPDGQIEEDEFYWHDTEVDGPIAMAMAEGGGEDERQAEEDRKKRAAGYVQKTTLTSSHPNWGDTYTTSWVKAPTSSPAASPAASPAPAPAPAPAPGGNPDWVRPNYVQGQLLGNRVNPSVNPANPTTAQYSSYVDSGGGMNNSWAFINARLQ